MPRPKKARPKKHARAWFEGTVKEIRGGVWRAWRARVRRPDGTSSRPSRTFYGSGAEQRAATWARGDPEPAVMYLGQWLERWLALSRPTIARNTYAIYRRDVTACGDLLLRPLDEVTTDDWQRLTNELLGRWSRHHVAVWRGNLSTALRAAVPRYLPENPLSRVRLPRAEEQPPKAWRQDELDRLLAAAEGGIHEAWLVFSLGTGVRLGEARALLWEDVDLVARKATIHRSADNQTSAIGPTKSRKIRVIDIADEAIPYLAEHRKRQRPGETLVFGHNGRPYDANAPRRWLALQCRNAGVRSLPPHSLRHSYASIALDDGVPPQDVAAQLGHTVATLLRVYAHWISDDKRRAATAVGKALRHRFSGPDQNLVQRMTRGGSSDQE